MPGGLLGVLQGTAGYCWALQGSARYCMVLLGTRGVLSAYWGKEGYWGYFGILHGTLGTGATRGCCAEGLRGSVRYCGLL